MKGPTRSPEIRRGVQLAAQLGYRVTFRPWVEDARTPGVMPGHFAGRTDHERREIVVSTYSGLTPRSRAELVAILSHELEHAQGAEHGTDNPAFGLRCGGTI